MDITKLPFDTDIMLAGLRPVGRDREPDLRCGARKRHAGSGLARMRRSPARPSSASPGAWVLAIARGRRFPFGHEDKPGILIMGHLDTVHPVGTLAKLPWRREENRCYGPGIFDMKGGNFIALEAIRMLQRLSLPPRCRSRSSSPATRRSAARRTRELIEAEAARHKYVLVPEPGRNDGGVVTGRYAIARFNLEGYRPAEPRGRAAEGGPLGDPHHGGHDPADRRHDHGRLHLQRRRDPWRPVGELRLERLRRGGAEHGEAAGRSRWRRAAHAGADQGR